MFAEQLQNNAQDNLMNSETISCGIFQETQSNFLLSLPEICLQYGLIQSK